MSENRAKILVIEDEPPLQKLLRVTLDANGYDVITAETGKAGLLKAATEQPDLLIVDLGLPDIDGLEIIRRVREWSAAGIIVVTARGKEHEKIVALDAGADDYLTKPFGVGELMARVRVALRHAVHNEHGNINAEIKLGNLQLNLTKREVLKNGARLQLTATEYRLLSTLAKNQGKVMTHRQLLKEVWGPGTTTEKHYVHVYMNQLRQKIEDDPSRPTILITEQGVGYRSIESDKSVLDEGG